MKKTKFLIDVVEHDLKHSLGLEKYREIKLLDKDYSLPMSKKPVDNLVKDLLILAKRCYNESYFKLPKDKRYKLVTGKILSNYYYPKFWD